MMKRKKVGGIRQLELPLVERSLKHGRARRDAGMEQVLSGTDVTDAMATVLFTYFAHGQIIIGEDVTVKCKELGIHVHHPNVWGASFNGVVRRGCVKRLIADPWGQSRVPTSNARPAIKYTVNHHD